jgi:tRNA threonylcarbamoyladenosine biosynthesis protein TsaE
MRIYLSGELGAGKTALVRAMLRALGFEGRVKSPTYTLVEPYIISSLYFYHFDFYRFHHPEEWTATGFRELFDGQSVCVVEWPEQAGTLLPPPDVRIRLEVAGTGRDASIEALNETGAACVSASKSLGGSS